MSEKNKPLPLHLRPEAIEDQVAGAVRRGDLDDLPGRGKPIPNLNDDPLWWVKDKLAREKASVLPASLQLRRDVEIALETIRATRSETKARELVEEINERIRKVNATLTSGPPSNLMPLDVEETMRRWRNEAL